MADGIGVRLGALYIQGSFQGSESTSKYSEPANPKILGRLLALLLLETPPSVTSPLNLTGMAARSVARSELRAERPNARKPFTLSALHPVSPEAQARKPRSCHTQATLRPVSAPSWELGSRESRTRAVPRTSPQLKCACKVETVAVRAGGACFFWFRIMWPSDSGPLILNAPRLEHRHRRCRCLAVESE